ncbi:MAG: STRUCTURAL ELEMENTS; Cell Exterior; surface polysaccharides/antigens [uncultured Chloroflexia bacterium]|uniref:STRUCTURAL ELEMENTS Cell Exterior surface polysaccharides/antigens n=1 Tax=uncultured Chloroflexia bacterium TaxID=1672391 RepID=A0A6J4N2A2_9CHLR|nr:MAG: STRUCTURAL ELEMENTS; Cell Exterior; surface polysaccharides/antigens [uncultured Chloroflexia bacterium]
MSKRKVLYVSHNHPSIRPGGAEAYALELYEAMRASDEFEPIFVARSGPPVSTASRPHEGTLFSTVNEDSNQYFFYTDFTSFDWFYGTSPNKEVYTKFFHELLVAYQPDVVHFQHTLFFGYDLIRHVKNVLPNTPIVYTLHEYLPICHRQGQMVRTGNQELCDESSPRRCHECFPEISPQAFFMRKRFIQSHFSLVDLFLAPSRFLLERYVDWGIPREKIRYEEYGRQVAYRSLDTEEERPRNRIGFFGQFNFFKGVHVLLEAMKILVEEECEAHLWLHGANLELQPEEFRRKLESLIEEAAQNVTLVGRYEHAALPRLMANVDWVVVPSVWWENSPLVIQEAFLHGRPVICSDIGGMAEKVADGVNGLHFAAGDPQSLAQTIRRAVSSPDLWESLREGSPEIYRIEDSVEVLTEVYSTLLDRKTAKV